MSKFKISVELQTAAALVAGLSPREQHKPLVHADEAVVVAMSDVARRRRDLEACERTVAELPGRIQRGEAKATALSEALVARTAAAMLIKPAEDVLAAARAKVAVEEAAAQRAVDREIGKRIEVLDRAAAEVTPLLAELVTLAAALAHLRGPGTILALEWPDSPACSANKRTMFLGDLK